MCEYQLCFTKVPEPLYKRKAFECGLDEEKLIDRVQLTEY